MIYLDSCATTKPSDEILDLYRNIMSKYWHNANSPYKLGQKVDAVLSLSKNALVDLLKLSQSHEVMFTSGGTEANNFAIYGVCNSYLGTNKSIITSKIEHPSVLSCYNDLEEKGFNVTYLNVDENGIIDLDELQNALTKDTILVSIQWVNNIVGSIQPINEILEILKNFPRVKFHVDGIQGIGKIQMDFNLNEIDLFTISAHKLHGLKGSGALIYKRNIFLNLPIKASKSGNSFPGTEDIGKAVTLVKAVEKVLQTVHGYYDHVTNLHTFLKNELEEKTSIKINGSCVDYSPYILNFSIIGHNSETVMHFLEMRDIYVATGSACSSKLKKPQATILAMTKDTSRANSTIRIGLSYETTKEELTTLVQALTLFCPKDTQMKGSN